MSNSSVSIFVGQFHKYRRDTTVWYMKIRHGNQEQIDTNRPCLIFKNVSVCVIKLDMDLTRGLSSRRPWGPVPGSPRARGPGPGAPGPGPRARGPGPGTLGARCPGPGAWDPGPRARAPGAGDGACLGPGARAQEVSLAFVTILGPFVFTQIQ